MRDKFSESLYNSGRIVRVYAGRLIGLCEMSEGMLEMSVDVRGEPLHWDAYAAVVMLVLVAPLMGIIYAALQIGRAHV